MTNKWAEQNLTAILLYHRIALPKLHSAVAGQYVAPCLLKSQILYLKKKQWQPVSLLESLHTRDSFSSDIFAITFDDGYLSVYDRAFPILMEAEVSATVYVVTSQIGGTNLWDHGLGDCIEDMMTQEQIIELHKAGFEIGSHTLSHPHLPQLTDKELEREISDSKKHLEDMLGNEVQSFAYPYGEYDSRVRDKVIEAGYKNAVSTKLGTYSEKSSVFDIPRINVRWNSFGPHLLKKIFRGAYRIA